MKQLVEVQDTNPQCAVHVRAKENSACYDLSNYVIVSKVKYSSSSDNSFKSLICLLCGVDWYLI